MDVVAASENTEASAVSAPSFNGNGPAPGVLDARPASAVVPIPRRLTRTQRFCKRMFDLLVVIPGLLFLWPVFALVALAIYLESGRPIIHRQARVGEGGRIFSMYKFRTMIPDAERRRRQTPIAFPDRRREHKLRSDPRITRIGRLLRRTSLDELPQLLNVLRGEMSLVGPRPEQPTIAMHYEAWQWERWSVPQGMTGLWQIRGRSLRPLYQHTGDDLEYIRTYSLWLDLKILVLTVVPVLSGRGAF